MFIAIDTFFKTNILQVNKSEYIAAANLYIDICSNFI